MSGIFKTRRIPKHLIIQEELHFRAKTRFNFWRLTFWVTIICLSAFALLQFRIWMS